MREIVFRNLSSPDKRRRDLMLTELRDEQGVATRVEKRYTYSVCHQHILQHPALVSEDAWDVGEVCDTEGRPRHIFVRKVRDTATGTETFTYKVLGHVDVRVGGSEYTVRYRHALHMVIAGDDGGPSAGLTP